MDNYLLQNDCKTLPIVLPIIVYTGNKKYNYSTNILDLFEKNKKLAKSIYFKPFHFVNLQEIDDKKFINNFYSALIVKTFKNYLANTENLLKIIMPNIIEIDKKGDLDFINIVLKYVYETREINSKNAFSKLLKMNLPKSTGEKIMTLADILRHEGHEKGWHIGLQEGEHNAAKRIALSLLQKNILSIEEIVSLTGLSKKEIEELI